MNVSFSFSLISQILHWKQTSIFYLKFLRKLINNNKIETNNLFIYTYWILEQTLVLHLSKNNPEITCLLGYSFDIYLDRSNTGYLPYRKTIYNGIDKIYFISEYGKNYFLELIYQKNMTE